jgi:hypothetical protein
MAIGKKQPTYSQGRCQKSVRCFRSVSSSWKSHADKDFDHDSVFGSDNNYHHAWSILTPQLQSCSQKSKTVKILSGATEYEYGVVERNRHGSPWRFATLHMSVAKTENKRVQKVEREPTCKINADAPPPFSFCRVLGGSCAVQDTA